jgi:hypothetical protein
MRLVFARLSNITSRLFGGAVVSFRRRGTAFGL